jgi:hypothetical protein
VTLFFMVKFSRRDFASLQIFQKIRLVFIYLCLISSRNAWHISGGEGQAANSANRRVLVTKSDGSQYVEEIKNDLGLKRGDTAGMMARLNAQGVSAVAAAGSGVAGTVSGRQEFGRPSKGLGGRQPTAPLEGTKSSYSYSRSSRGAVQSKSSHEEEYALELLEALRGQLTSRGAKGLIGLQRQFRIMDDDGSRSLDLKEFKKAMADTHVRMKSASDAEILFRLFGMQILAYDFHIAYPLVCYRAFGLHTRQLSSPTMNHPLPPQHVSYPHLQRLPLRS